MKKKYNVVYYNTKINAFNYFKIFQNVRYTSILVNKYITRFKISNKKLNI